MPELCLNDGHIRTKTGILESDITFKDTLESLIQQVKDGKLTAEVVTYSKNHNGKTVLILGDGDPAMELSEHGIFCYCWSGAS